jgi:16S rRNA (guanine527-N7)-methyltransferase
LLKGAQVDFPGGLPDGEINMERKLIQMLTEEARRLGIALGPREEAYFALFYDEFQKWNAKMNLTSLKAGPSFIAKHFIDSLMALSLIPPSAKTLLDLGTGGGFPGIPLKIVSNHLQVTLLDSSRKKTSFLRQAIVLLGLSDAAVITDRAEELIRQGKGPGEYDVVISRATFKLAQLIEVGGYFCKKDGMIIAMKGRDVRDEMEEAKPVMMRQGLRLAEKEEKVLHCSGEMRTLLVYKKD